MKMKGDNMTQNDIASFSKKVAGLMYLSTILWVLVICFQFIIGLITLIFGYGIITLAIMIYNIIAVIRYTKNIKIIKKVNTLEGALNMIKYFEDSIWVCILFMIINAVLGGVVGFIGNFYDLMLALYVKSKKKDFMIEELFSEEVTYEEL